LLVERIFCARALVITNAALTHTRMTTRDLRILSFIFGSDGIVMKTAPETEVAGNKNSVPFAGEFS